MRSKTVRVAALAVIALLVLLLFVLKPLGHNLVVKAYFTNAFGLKPGAVVRLAGVDVGSVRSVRARPELKQTPVEVVMALKPAYDLNIPSDSTASLETAGVLGETYVEIDASSGSGPPIATNGVLKTKPTEVLNAGQVLEKLVDKLNKQLDAMSKQLEKCESQKGLSRDESPKKTLNPAQ